MRMISVSFGRLFSFFLLFLPCTYSYSQQNLFNIPSGDITHEGKFFYQHQINVHSDEFESKSHLVYGLGDGWDVALNLVGKGASFSPDWQIRYNDNPDRGALYPLLMSAVQKQFNIFDNLDINLGTQLGFNISSELSNKEFAFFNYGIGVFHFMDKKSRIVGGMYQTNEIVVGQGNKIGVMLGYEVKLTDKFYLMGDWISGNNESSVGVFGFMYNIGKQTQLCIGALVPNPDTPKPFGVVLELNLLGWEL